jgi:acyl-CoA thioester hydrolase
MPPDSSGRVEPQRERAVRSEVRVRYAETDQMGVVYHAQYLVWCDIGRTEYIRRLGVSYAELERGGLRLAVAEAMLRFHAPARYDDIIHIDTRVERVQSRTLTFHYEILRAGPEPERLVTASTRMIALDAHGRTRTLPPELIQLFRVRAGAPR